jgi:hypothetical protein
MPVERLETGALRFEVQPPSTKAIAIKAAVENVLS